MKRRPGLWCFISCLAVAGSVSAEDPKSGNVTVQPWTGARLNFTPNAKTAALSYYQWFGDFLQGYVQVTAPLDADTRVAAFTGNNRLASGFGAQAQLGYDTRAAHVRRLAALLEEWRAGALRVNVIPVGVESGFFLQKLVRGTFCGEGIPCSLETQQHWTCRLFGIASCPDEKATDSLSEGVAAFVKDHCDGPKAKRTRSVMRRR